MNLTLKNVTTKSEIAKLGSAITIVGLTIGKDGSEAFAEWCDNIAKFKTDNHVGYLIKGNVMNKLYHLTGDNAYPSDLNIISFALNDFVESSKFVMARFDIDAKWLDDIVDNNVMREKESRAA